MTGVSEVDPPDVDAAPAPLPPRVRWPPEYPQVIVHTEVVLRDHHPSYVAAKSGDAQAALALVEDLLSGAATSALREQLAGQAATLLPVAALETTGFNAIPDAMAQVLGAELRLAVSFGEIVQNNRVGHTRALAFNRLVTPAAFEGDVVAGQAYVLVDDHVGLGGTLANLRGHIESHGGRVLAMTALTESRGARQIALRTETLTVLWKRHGQDLEQFWKAQFGHALDCLTDIEGQVLGREPTVDAIRNRLAQAAIEARRRGVDPAVDVGR